jgi:hypothetical protein
MSESSHAAVYQSLATGLVLRGGDPVGVFRIAAEELGRQLAEKGYNLDAIGREISSFGESYFDLLAKLRQAPEATH